MTMRNVLNKSQLGMSSEMHTMEGLERCRAVK